MWGGCGFGVLDGENWGLEMNGGWGKEILCNRVSLGMIGKSLFCIAMKGAGFAVVNTRHVPHMFYGLGQYKPLFNWLRPPPGGAFFGCGRVS